ncbi:MAG: hypothetical protein J5654_11370 [Victivallales bacterium]|nr:hypothetical protein [Victivallales bacterium]
MKILITGACAVSARSVLRSLKMSKVFGDCEFIGWDACTLLYGVYAKAFDRLYKVPPVSSPEYERIAREIIAKEKFDAAILVPEVEVVFWSRRDLGVPCLLPPPKFAQLAISKERVFAALQATDLVPKHFSAAAAAIQSEGFENPLGYPVWIRDGGAGTASAKGAFKAFSHADLKAWCQINTGIDHFQLSEFLPGSNYGCFCLFKDGRLVKMCQAERIEYIMAKVAVSGITGNTSKGRLLNDDNIRKVALEVISRLCEQTGEVMNGLVVVDMKCKTDGYPVATEINLRHVAFSSMFASAGFNVSEYQLLLALGRDDEISPEVEKQFPVGNLMLRDVDGEPIYVEHPQPIAVGEFVGK